MRIGVDLGGTKIEAVVLDSQGHITLKRRIPSPSSSYPDIVRAIAELVHDLESCCGERCSVGIGTPGAASAETGLMKNCNSTVINGKPLKEDLEKALGREIRMANDANCFALSEAVDGAGRHCNLVFGVILGTGVGGGLVNRGQALLGANHIGGEWGHNTLVGATEERDCYCGKSNCVETYLCGGGLLKTAQGVLPALASTRELANLAQTADPLATGVLKVYAAQLAEALSVVMNILDPDIIVLGGGVSNIQALYPLVNGQLPEKVFGGECRTQVVPAKYGDSSGVRGAAWLWPQ